MLDSTAGAQPPLRKKAARAPRRERISPFRARIAAAATLAITTTAFAGCASVPSPLTPAWHGSIGLPARGVLADGDQVRRDAEGLVWLRGNDRHWALPRFARAIERAARRVAQERPGGTLSVGDLSTRTGGGPLPPHFSHRSGRDADLLFYVSTLDGAPVTSPGFIHVGADGIAQDEAHDRWLRLDVAREWLLVRALLTDPGARIQWVFVSDVVKALLLEHAVALGEPAEILRRAQEVMLEPHPGGVHDDHIHIRTACSPDEVVAGCAPSGPARSWLASEPAMATDDGGGAGTDADLVRALLEPSPAPMPLASLPAGPGPIP